MVPPPRWHPQGEGQELQTVPSAGTVPAPGSAGLPRASVSPASSTTRVTLQKRGCAEQPLSQIRSFPCPVSFSQPFPHENVQKKKYNNNNKKKNSSIWMLFPPRRRPRGREPRAQRL